MLHRMPVVNWISPGIAAPPLRSTRSTNLDRNRPNQPSRKFHWVACPAGVEPATYGLEGLANLQNTILNNDLQCPNLGVRRNTGGYGIGWGPMSGSWCQ